MMELPQSYRQTLNVMPDLVFGEDQHSYTRKVIAWAEGQGIGTAEAIRCAKIKWQAWEVSRLLIEIEDGRQGALERAVTMLLKDRYLP